MKPTDPNVASVDEPRLAGQNLAIYRALKRGPRTNAELAEISLKYTSRISDLRKHGIDVICERQSGGTTVYRINER